MFSILGALPPAPPCDEFLSINYKQPGSFKNTSPFRHTGIFQKTPHHFVTRGLGGRAPKIEIDFPDPTICILQATETTK